MSLFVSAGGARFEPYFNQAGPLPSYQETRSVDQANAALAGESSPTTTLVPEQQAILKKIAVYQQELEERQKEKKLAFLARHLMTPDPVTIAPDQSLFEIQRVFADRGFRHLPVVDETGRLVGIVSDRDILKFSRLTDEQAQSVPVSHMMTPRAYAATTDTSIYDIAKLMLTEKFSSLPILSTEHDLIGIVTTTDILKGLLRRVPVELWV